MTDFRDFDDREFDLPGDEPPDEPDMAVFNQTEDDPR